MLYVLAAWTGLRRAELASLTRRSFCWDSEPPTLRVEARHSKRRKRDVLPIHPEVASRLQEWLANKSPEDSEPIFALRSAGGWLKKTSKMMQRDLAAAGIPYADEHGLYADFHANRHTFITNLARAGVAPKVAQSLARRSDINLTMNVYTHVEQGQQMAAVGALSAPPPTRSSRPTGQTGRRRSTPPSGIGVAACGIAG